jgi:RHS repeat-associated protein
LGTPQKLVGKSGAKDWEGEYRAFGEIVAETGGWESRLRFPGQYFDEETNNYYNYFRDYDPATGRYLQSDPIGLKGGNNTYVYVFNNPLTSFDALGLWCISMPSKTTAWKEVGRRKYTGKDMVSPQSMGSFGWCYWKREYKQRMMRYVTNVKLCWECTKAKCQDERCSLKYKFGPKKKEWDDKYGWEHGDTTRQDITGTPGNEQGCCKNPWTGQLSCGPIYPKM